MSTTWSGTTTKVITTTNTTTTLTAATTTILFFVLTGQFFHSYSRSGFPKMNFLE